MSQMHADKLNWKRNRREFFRQNRFWKINFRQPKNESAMADGSRRSAVQTDGKQTGCERFPLVQKRCRAALATAVQDGKPEIDYGVCVLRFP